jgi:hypothetical protein
MPPAWTVDEAVRVFASQDMPIDKWRLALMVRAVSLQPVGRTPSGQHGGRGYALYPVGALQRMHALIVDLQPSPEISDDGP